MRRILILALLLLAITATFAGAETPNPGVKVQTIFDFKDELGLQPEQIKAIKAHILTLTTNLKTTQARLKTLEKEYKALLASEPNTAQVRAKLDEIAEATTQLRLLDFEVGRSITQALTAEQLQKWRAIQQRVRQAKKSKGGA